MVAVNFKDALWVVFGNRRLRAMKDARKKGLSDEFVDVIVSELTVDGVGNALLPLFCKFLDAWTTESTKSRAVCRDGEGGRE